MVKAVVVLVVACCEDDATVDRKGIMTKRSIADVFNRENIKPKFYYGQNKYYVALNYHPSALVCAG